MLQKNSSSFENKTKKKKTKKHENKRKRSGSVVKLYEKNSIGIIIKKNSLHEKKNINKTNLQNSFEDLENSDIKITEKNENFNSSDEKLIEKQKQKIKKNSFTSEIKKNSHNSNDNTDKQENDDSSEEKKSNKNFINNKLKNHKNKKVLNKKKEVELKNTNINEKNSQYEKDVILTVGSMDENKIGSQEFNINNSNNIILNNYVKEKISPSKSTNIQINNKMSWRKMTKGK